MENLNSNNDKKQKSSLLYLIIFFIYTAIIITIIVVFGKKYIYLFLPKMKEEILYYSFIGHGIGAFLSLIFGIIIYIVGLAITFNIFEKLMSFKKPIIILLCSILGLIFVLKSSYTLITPTKVIYKDFFTTETYELKNTDAIKVWLNYSGKTKDIKNVELCLLFNNKEIGLNSGFSGNVYFDDIIKILKTKTDLNVKNINKIYSVNSKSLTYQDTIDVLSFYNEPYYKDAIIDLNK